MKASIAIVALWVVIAISLLHAREQREQWKAEQIERATGGFYE